MSTYDRNKHGWNRDWETDNVPDDEPVDMSGVHIETCEGCDFPMAECTCESIGRLAKLVDRLNPGQFVTVNVGDLRQLLASRKRGSAL